MKLGCKEAHKTSSGSTFGQRVLHSHCSVLHGRVVGDWAGGSYISRPCKLEPSFQDDRHKPQSTVVAVAVWYPGGLPSSDMCRQHDQSGSAAPQRRQASKNQPAHLLQAFCFTWYACIVPCEGYVVSYIRVMMSYESVCSLVQTAVQEVHIDLMSALY